MPRFSIKNLMLATLLVAAGLAVCLVPLNYAGDMSLSARLHIALLAFGVGGAMIGAGVMAPFHKKATGAAIGLALGGVFLAILTAW